MEFLSVLRSSYNFNDFMCSFGEFVFKLFSKRLKDDAHVHRKLSTTEIFFKFNKLLFFSFLL